LGFTRERGLLSPKRERPQIPPGAENSPQIGGPQALGPFQGIMKLKQGVFGGPMGWDPTNLSQLMAQNWGKKKIGPCKME